MFVSRCCVTIIKITSPQNTHWNKNIDADVGKADNLSSFDPTEKRINLYTQWIKERMNV